MIEQLKSDFNKMTENLKFSENNIEFRKKNLINFIDKGFPNKRIEDWKFSDLNQIISSNIKNLSFSYSYWVVIIPFISCFCFQFDGIFIGASQTKELRNAMIVSVSIYIVCALFLTSSFDNSGLWISLCIFFALRALTLFFYLSKIYQRIV